MLVPANIRIQIVLLMAKFELPAAVIQELQIEFGRSTPSERTIAATFQRFCETDIVEDDERSGRPSKNSEEKIEEVSDVIESQPQSSVRTAATACSIPLTTAHRIMTPISFFETVQNALCSITL